MTAGTYTWQQASPVWFLVCRSLSCSEVRFSTRTQPSCKEQTLDIRKTGWTVRPCRNPQLQIWIWVVWFLGAGKIILCFIGKGEYVYPIACQDWEVQFCQWPDFFSVFCSVVSPQAEECLELSFQSLELQGTGWTPGFAELGRTWQFQLFNGCGESKRSN